MFNKNDYFSQCENEQQFKMLYTKKLASESEYRFCIETEETVKGFPDVLIYDRNVKMARFEEFKFTKNGKIKFQSTQPAFYKKYKDLYIEVLAYNKKSNCLHWFMVTELFNKSSPYCLNEKSEVNLGLAEAMLRDNVK